MTTAMNTEALDEAVSPKDLFAATTRPGITQQEMIQGYTNWSEDAKYDEVMSVCVCLCVYMCMFVCGCVSVCFPCPLVLGCECFCVKVCQFV